MRVLVLLLAACLSLPGALAAFGPESPDGYPVNVDGEVIHPPVPVQTLLEDPLNKLESNTIYPYYPILTAEVQRLAEEHPDLVRLHSVGQSRLGLDIWMLEIADFDNPDRIPLAQREVVYLDGGTHSNEYSGVYFVTEWAQFLLDEYETNETAAWIVENRHTFIVPMVNPDGSNAFGRLNALGVNINRNFPSTWGTTTEMPPFNYAGPYPASEPETQIVVGLFHDLKPDYVASIHCCGNMWLYPYGAEHLGDPVDKPHLERICDEVYAEVRETCGPIWSTIYPASGSTTDEAYEVAGSSAWGFEMSGRGAVAPWGQPVITDDVREQERESWGGVLHAFLNVDKYGALPKVIDMVGTASHLDVTLRNEGWGNVSEGTIEVGGNKQVLPALEPGQEVTLRFHGDYHAGAVPVEVEWKKRLHVESTWGVERIGVALEETAGGLKALLDVDGDLVSTPLYLDDVPAFQASEEAPGVPVLLVVTAVAGLAVALRRKR